MFMPDIYIPATTTPAALPIRKVNPDTDFEQIANLIEICFGAQMDEDGQEYLRQIRRAAKNNNYLNWVRGSNEWVQLPLHGYVYLEGERIIGNVTLVPFQKSGKWVYLICNVAVHPEFRQRGIGRILTRRGLEHIRQQKASAAWLQVREDNLPAIHLYETEGFQPRAVRTLWRNRPETDLAPDPIPGLNVQLRRRKDWPLQKDWLEHTYPEVVAWNLPFRADAFAPGIWKQLVYYVRGDHVENWVARRDNETVGAVSWSESPYPMESIWPVVKTPEDQPTLEALLRYMRPRIPRRHPITVNYPAGQGEEAFTRTGYSKQNTLIWMEEVIE